MSEHVVTERPRFRDPELDRRYESEGFVVVPAAAVAAVRPLRRLYRDTIGSAPAGFHSTMYTDDSDLKRRVNSDVTELLLPLIDAQLTNYRPLLANFITKRRGTEGVMSAHMDWTFVDEPQVNSMNFWVPLVDVSRKNGAISVLPGSHRMPLTIRGTGTSNPFIAVEATVADRMIELPMRAGDVLIHDHRMLHSSSANLRRQVRLVAACALVPTSSQAVHYLQGPSTLVRHVLQDSFFTDHTFGETSLPSSARLIGPRDFANPVFTEEDLPTR